MSTAASGDADPSVSAADNPVESVVGESATRDRLVDGFKDAGTRPSERRRSRRAVWWSVGTLAVVAAVAVPVSARLVGSAPERLRTPDRVAGFTLDRDADAVATADYLRNGIAAGLGLDASVGAVYVDGGGDTHSVIFVGGTSGPGSVSTRLADLFSLLNDGSGGLTTPVTEPAGSLGGQVRCALSTDASPAGGTVVAQGADEMAVCGWADASTVGLALFPNRTLDQAAELLREMRPGLSGK